MDFKSYQSLFHSILTDQVKSEPYDHPEYFNYATLNWFRQERWMRKGVLNTELVEKISSLKVQQWIFITEPWCGDAAHTLPFIVRLLENSRNISLDIRRRDGDPDIVDDYLSGHSRSIPKLIVRDIHQNDKFVWGPRPLECQMLYDELIDEQMDHERVEMELQKWYNADKGKSFQLELLERLNAMDENPGIENLMSAENALGVTI